MTSVRVERLDHLGLIASTVKDLGLIDMIDARLVPDAQEEITPGEAIAGMLLNGLGFANKPMTLTPQFFANKPLDLLFRAGVHAEMFNRFKLGRTLDEVHAYGCDVLFSELALAVCEHEGIAQRFHHLDTTSLALSGDDIPESATQAIHITHGGTFQNRAKVVDSLPADTLGIAGCRHNPAPRAKRSMRLNFSTDGTIRPLQSPVVGGCSLKRLEALRSLGLASSSADSSTPRC